MSETTSNSERPRATTYTAVSGVARARPRARVAIVKGQDATRWRDFYHVILTVPWSAFLLGLLALFLLLNTMFALLYLADAHGFQGGARGSFWETFLFSVGTIGSTNYSTLAPKSLYADVVYVMQTFINYIYLGFVTSVMYARFSRPFARVVFSNVAVIAPFDGVPTLMFRAANQRGNAIVDAEAKVTLARRQVTKEGIVMRRFEELRLTRERSSLFALSWTVMHRIDGASPLHGVTQDMLYDGEMEVVVLLSGTDETLADRIYARHSYTPDEVLWDRRFVDVLSVTAKGRRMVDLTRFHDTDPVEALDPGG